MIQTGWDVFLLHRCEGRVFHMYDITLRGSVEEGAKEVCKCREMDRPRIQRTLTRLLLHTIDCAQSQVANSVLLALELRLAF